MPSAIAVEAINHGPGEVTLTGAVGKIKGKWPWRKSKRALLRAYAQYPNTLSILDFGQTPGLPKRVGMGEGCTVYYPNSILVNSELENMAFTDGFGREHFADRRSRKNLKDALRSPS